MSELCEESKWEKACKIGLFLFDGKNCLLFLKKISKSVLTMIWEGAILRFVAGEDGNDNKKLFKRKEKSC